MKAIEVEIQEPSPEGEILRGVHEHQTVYTLKVTNNRVNPTIGTKLDAYVPAGLEFLGCGGPGADNTTGAPTNPGSAEEYEGSGPIEVEPLAGCVEPESVETEVVDPDGAGPMPEGAYTHVVWDVGTLADGETKLFPYRAAVPIRENTNTFTGLRPGAASGDQATNLDNNSGSEVTDETLLRTYASAGGTYQGNGGPVPASDEQILDRTAEDWVVHKSGSSGTLAQGAITEWTLVFETSEYKFIDGALVTDTLPSGLCPLGAANYTTENTSDDSECDPVGGQLPSAPYASATENADGTFTLVWDAGSLAELGHTDVSDRFEITFPTRTRVNYQQDFEATTPILTFDRLANTVETEGEGWARCTAPGTPDCSTPGPKIDFDGTDGSTIVDASAAEQEAGGPLISKQVAQSGTDCLAATYVDTVPVYHPGDRVCWKVRVDFPGAVDTAPQAIADFMPASVEYEAASDQVTPANNVISTIDESGAGEGLLTWTVEGSVVPAGSQVFDHVFSTIAMPPGTPAPGDLTGNLLKFSSVNTPGESQPQRAEAEYEIELPEVDLVKGVEEVVRGGSTVDGPNGPNVDHKQVQADDEVTYRVDVSNGGGQDAVGVEVWDVLPAGYDCAAIGAISDGGECVSASPTDRIVWSGLAVAAAGSKKLAYTATVPSDIGPGRTLDNEAGVREFAGETNLGGTFTYTPAGNIDPSNPNPANAPAADDASDVFTAAVSLAKAQTTSVNEAGNNANAQATIGERIKYTVTATIPEGTTLGGTAELTDLVNSTERQAYVAGTATVTLDGGALPVGFTLDDSGATPRIVFPADYVNAPGSGNDVLVMSFEMRVTDVASNTRTSSNLTNQASLKWTDPVEGAKSAPSNTTSTQVVEPLIAQAKSDDVNPATVNPGDIVAYTVTTSNGPGTQVSTAHEVEIVDTIPAGLVPLGEAPGNAPLVDGAEVPGSGGAIWDADTRTVSKTVATIAPGASSAFSYRAEVEKPAIAGSTLTNVVEATTASLDEGVSGRRTSGTGYADSAEDTIQIGGASIGKQVTPSEATIGETLDYELTVTIPANVELFDTTVIDVVPNNLQFDGYLGEECLSGCPLSNPINRYAATVPGDGTTRIAWDLGDIPALSQPQEVKLSYSAFVRDRRQTVGGEVLAGQTAVNTATVNSNRSDKVTEFDESEVPSEFDDPSEPVESSATVVEPQLTLDKQIKVGDGAFGNGPTPAHSDETLTYRLAIANSGDSPAYDVVAIDQPDAALTEVEIEAQAGVTVTDGWSEADPDIAWLIDGPLAAEGGGVTLTYTARFVDASQLHDGQQVPNTARVPHYFGAPEAERDANPTHTYRDYEDGGEDSTEAVLDFPTLTIAKTTGLGGNPETGNAEIGQPFPWRVVVGNTSPTAGATDVELRDVLPPNWDYVAGSTSFDGGAAADPTVTLGASGDVLEWTVPALPAASSVTIEFEATPQPEAATDPGTGAEANVNTAAAVGATDEAGNSGNEEGPYEAGPDTATATLQVPQLGIAKTPDGGSATAGEPASYTVKVENTGSAPARNVVVTDVLPAGASYTPGSATAEPTAGFGEDSVSPGPGAGQTTVVWTIAELAPSASVEITAPVDVAADVADGTTLVNTASAVSDELPDPVEDEGSLEASTGADMAITKSGDATYTAGTEFTWQLRVQNLGPSDAQNVVVTDPLPAGTSFVAADPPCTAAGGEVRCALGTVAAGFDETYDLAVAVAPDTTAAPLDNTATVETTTTDEEPDNDESTDGPGPSPLADVWIAKTADPTAILHNHQTTFTIVAHNDGPSTARGVVVEDVLPAALEYVSVTGPGCEQSDGTVTCNLGDLAPGGAAEIELTVRGIESGEWDNAATVETTTPEIPDHKPNSVEAEVIVGPVAELGIVKDGPATVAADGDVTYTLTVTNNGPDDATGVTIEDRLPAGAVFVSADAGCGEASGTVTCAVGDLAVSDSAERQITVKVPRALADTTIVNAASVHGNEGDDEPENDSDEVETKAGPSADVAIVKSGPPAVAANGTVAWSLLVTNSGPSTATGVTVDDALPAGVTLVSATTTQGGCGAAAGAVRCELGSLPSGGSAQLQVVVHVPPALVGATLLNTATVGAEEPDPNPENNKSSATTTVGPQPKGQGPTGYDLAISKTIEGKGRPALGEVVRYSLTVVNHGPATATGVKVTDALPGRVEYLSAKLPGGKCSFDGSAVTCKLPSLAAGAQRRAAVKVRAMEGGQLRNSATVQSAGGDRDPKNDRASAATNVKAPKARLKLIKQRVGRGAVEPGERIRFKITVRNVTRNAAADVVVCDRPPAGMTFAKTKGARLQRGNACWSIEMLPGRGKRSFHLVTRLSGGFDGRAVRNVAFLKGDNAPRARDVAGVRVESESAGRGGGVTG